MCLASSTHPTPSLLPFGGFEQPGDAVVKIDSADIQETTWVIECASGDSAVTSLQAGTTAIHSRLLILGRSVVLSLFNTGEDQADRKVRYARAEGLKLSELDATPREMIVQLIEKQFPIYQYHEQSDPPRTNNAASFTRFGPPGRRTNRRRPLAACNRSNQTSAPIIRLALLDLAGQKRLVNAVSKRLSALGALTQGERLSLSNDLFRPEDVTDEYGKSALARLYREIVSGRHSEDGIGMAELERMGVLNREKTAVRENYVSNVEQFVNRILVLHVDVQNRIFDIFYEHYPEAVDAALRKRSPLETLRGIHERCRPIESR